MTDQKHHTTAIQRLTCATAVVVGLASWLPVSANAGVVEEVVKVPATVQDSYGKRIEHELVVTIFRDDTAQAPRPLVLINHGRAADAIERAKLGRVKYSAVSKWFVQQGYVVALPTRIGYGETGGEDVEDSGTCNNKRYEPAYEAAAVESQAVIDVLRSRPEIDSKRILVVGQSFGGATSIGVAAKDVPGLKAVINFAGGGGGNPKTQAQRPCGTTQLERLFKQYGKANKVPTLWIYTENDQWMGPKFPREWFESFKAEGGQGEFVLYPPLGDDGHGLFSKSPGTWQPRVQNFIQANVGP